MNNDNHYAARHALRFRLFGVLAEADKKFTRARRDLAALSPAARENPAFAAALETLRSDLVAARADIVSAGFCGADDFFTPLV